ncbi:MAG TPA: hypothetical protein VER03_20590 [Bryobacteraceae bacterium]|nr:hypothetical protein [Bryobacteraceae bacterium]
MFCPNCGASVQGRFCAKCGTSVDAAAAPPPGAQSYNTGTAPGAHPYSAPVATAGGMAPNVAGALSYLLGFITGILFLVLTPYNQDKFVRFHAFQSIFLNAAWIAFWIVETIIMMMLPWGLVTVLSLVAMLLSLAFLGLWILLMVKAYQGERFKLPIIGDLAEKQA